MQVRKRLRKKIGSELEETKRSLFEIAKKAKKVHAVCKNVFSKPENLLYGVGSAITTVLLGMWFANIGIIQTVFSSMSLSMVDKIDFLFTMLGTLLRNMSAFQVVLIALHGVLWCIVAAFWLEAIRLQHEQQRLREVFGALLFGTLFVGALAIFAISLVTPVITRLGLNVFVSEHFSGTLILLCAVVADTSLISRFAHRFARHVNNATRSAAIQ